MRRGACASRSSRRQPSSIEKSITEFCLLMPTRSTSRRRRRRRVAAAAHALQRRHARIVPAVDQAFADQRHQLALAHHRVVDVEARELDLARLARPAFGRPLASSGASSSGDVRQVDLVDAPVVQRPVVLELERAQRMRDALDRVAERVRVVVHRIDRPGVAGVLVRHLLDPVQRRVAQVDVAAGHVDLRAQGARAVGELAGAHAPEQVEVLVDASGRGTANCGPARSACRDIRAPRSARQVADEGVALARSASRRRGRRPRSSPRRGAARPSRSPASARRPGSPATNSGSSLAGLVSSKRRLQTPPNSRGEAEVQADRLGVADVQVAVGLGREAGADARRACRWRGRRGRSGG